MSAVQEDSWCDPVGSGPRGGSSSAEAVEEASDACVDHTSETDTEWWSLDPQAFSTAVRLIEVRAGSSHEPGTAGCEV